MKVAVTGASGLIGTALVTELTHGGESVTVLTRDPGRARARLSPPARRAGSRSRTGMAPALELVRWEPLREPAPAHALAGCDAIVHLAGEPIAKRWSEPAKRAIRESRVVGTRNLIEGLRALDADDLPQALVSSSGVNYYGPHGSEPIDEEAPPGSDFLAQVCVEWETEARAAEQLGLRTVQMRTGVVLDRGGGALAKMLPPFRLGIGGPVAGGRQYMAWIHRDDVIGMMLAALMDDRWSGPINATAPTPVTNRELSRALGRALGRPALLPVPGLALRALYGEMAQLVIAGVRAVPARALVLGYEFAHPELDEALRAALG
jgi:uncharacterized protein